MTCLHHGRSTAAIRGDGMEIGTAKCECDSDCACKSYRATPCPLTTSQVVEALVWAARAMSRTLNVGAFECQGNKDMGAWCRDVRPGDLVYAVTARSGMNGVEAIDRVGVVMFVEDRVVCRHLLADVNLEHCREPECEPDNCWQEHFTWVRTLRARHRWYNESFSRIPRNAAEYDEMASGRLRPPEAK